MLPGWSVSQRQQITNAVLADYAIPVEVHPSADHDGTPHWEARVFGGTLEAALERIHAKQDRIVRRVAEHGMKTVTRLDALFMYASQWIEWTMNQAEPGAEDLDLVEMHDLMEGWLTLYMTLGDEFPS